MRSEEVTTTGSMATATENPAGDEPRPERTPGSRRARTCGWSGASTDSCGRGPETVKSG